MPRHDGERETDPVETTPARRLEREGDGDEHHDQIDEREGQLGVELDEMFADLEAGRLEPGDVVLELPEAHRIDGLLDADEVLHLLRQVQRRWRRRARGPGPARSPGRG